MGRLAHAMGSLKKAMRWDEDTFGREYDLDIFNIVAVDDFNMGGLATSVCTHANKHEHARTRARAPAHTLRS